MKLIIILIIILKLAITDCKSLYDNRDLTRKQPKQFKNIILNANTITKMNFDEKLSIECPIQDLKSVKNNRETHYNKKKSTPIFITTWYKNQIKINQFIDEEFERIKIFGQRIKINGLLSSDSGVYFCEVIMGTGINFRSSNLTLLVNDPIQNGKYILFYCVSIKH